MTLISPKFEMVFTHDLVRYGSYGRVGLHAFARVRFIIRIPVLSEQQKRTPKERIHLNGSGIACIIAGKRLDYIQSETRFCRYTPGSELSTHTYSIGHEVLYNTSCALTDAKRSPLLL